MRVDGQARAYALKALDTEVESPHKSLALGLGTILTSVIAEYARDATAVAECRDWTKRAIEVGTRSGPAWRAFALVVAGQIELILRDVAAADAFLTEALDAWHEPSISV